jgi:hypothetical protein
MAAWNSRRSRLERWMTERIATSRTRRALLAGFALCSASVSLATCALTY